MQIDFLVKLASLTFMNFNLILGTDMDVLGYNKIVLN